VHFAGYDPDALSPVGMLMYPDIAQSPDSMMLAPYWYRQFHIH
jgi:hypothetical protein